MALQYDVGYRVQAIDELGRWGNGKIIDCNTDKFKIRFDGYGCLCDRVVNLHEIRGRLPSLRDINLSK